MQYKVLITLIVPETEEKFEAYIPINKTVFAVSELLAKLIEAESKSINEKIALFLYDRRTGLQYESTKLIRETNIRNGSEVVAITQKAQKPQEHTESTPNPTQLPVERDTQTTEPSINQDIKPQTYAEKSIVNDQTVISIDHQQNTKNEITNI